MLLGEIVTIVVARRAMAEIDAWSEKERGAARHTCDHARLEPGRLRLRPAHDCAHRLRSAAQRHPNR